MNKSSFFLFILTSFLFASCGEDDPAQQQTSGPMPMPVVEIPIKTVTGYTTYPVSIQGIVNSDVRAKASGFITDVLVDEGEKVQQGDLMFRIETQSLSEDANAAQANVNAAQVGVDQLKPLVEKNIISEVQLQTAKAKLAQARANYNSIMANIGYAAIRSPIDGYVGAIPFRQGSLVSPSTAIPLTTVSNTDEVYAYFAMNEADYLDFIQNAEGENLVEKIENFPPVQLQLANGEMYGENGEIETVTGQIDPSLGTVSYRAVFPNPDRLLANGGSGTIHIPKTYQDVPVVPEASTYERQGKVYAYKVSGDTLATPIVIEVRDRVQNFIVVESGIEAGDRIIAKGAGKLQGPTPIKPQPVAFDSIAKTLKPVFK